jgi:hypothetical protein
MEQGKEPSLRLHLTVHECARQEAMTYSLAFAGDFGWYLRRRPDGASFGKNVEEMNICLISNERQPTLEFALYWPICSPSHLRRPVSSAVADWIPACAGMTG